MILEKIFRAYLDYTSEKYGHEHKENEIHVHDLVRCKHKSKMEDLFPEFARSPSPNIFIGEAVDEFVKKIVEMQREKLFQDLETTEVEISREIVIEKKDGAEKVVIIGKPDIILSDAVVEIKYARSIEDKPLDHHVMQLKTYMFLTKKEKGYLIYITPRGLKEFKIEENVDEEFVKKLLQEWSSPRFEWECEYCQFREICPNRIIGSKEES
ncbi:MAG: CRISPR-associated protein Cas4 [Candidatus Njordarchaeales archaeon]